MPGIIEAPRSIVLAADMAPVAYEPIVRDLAGVEGLGGIKLGFKIGYSRISLPGAVDIVREVDPDLKVIFDHQKAGTDIIDTGKDFAEAMTEAKVDAAILFPFTGPKVQHNWVRELQKKNIPAICGAEMTHEGQVAESDGTQGGYIHPRAFERIFTLAVQLDVRDFVVPGNKAERVAHYRTFIGSLLGQEEFTLWAPGFVTQGGDVSETGAAAGPNFHAIVGRGIYGAEQPRVAAMALGQKLLGRNR
ncbi:MAG TPA: orotidine 5'-phosphate decarboxylase / HUMPS family protein [Candidatus Saccharimonadales bacterium]|nr:orotidine 5'-phosphate decarboxylase / HUMPS family protein [Candidatus Saccharimonadales bacterium]